MESKVKRKFTQYMEKHGFIVVHIIVCNKPGWPDTICLKSGNITFIEFKDNPHSIGNLRPLQSYYLNLIREHKFPSYVADKFNWQSLADHIIQQSEL